jgi:hypothetical protein
VDPEHDSLRALMRRKIQDASREAIESSGVTSPDTVAELERLARLIDLRERETPARPGRRWPAALLVGLTMLIVGLLLFVRVAETEIELEVTASEVGFVLSQPQPVTDIVNLESVSVSGVRTLRLPEPLRSRRTSSEGAGNGASVRLRASSLAGRPGTVTLSPLALPSGVEVRVDSAATGGGHRLSLNGGGASVQITVHGPVAVGLAAGELETVDFEVPKSIAFETDAAGAVLELIPAAGASTEFAPQLSVEQLSFARIDEFQTRSGTTAQAVSTVLSGTLYLESLNGTARQLRPRELVRFDDIGGTVRTLQIEDGRVAVNFRGTTRGIRSGWSDRPANLMPTYLDWLQAHHGLSLLWGTTLYLFGVAATILRWWRVDV